MTVTNNERRQQFEVRSGDYLAELQYRIREGKMYFLHTGVPKPLAGQGIASKLAKTALTYANEHKYEIVVYCPFVKGYLERHPEYLNK